MSGHDPLEPVVEGYSVGCVQGGKKKFSAARLRYRNGAKDARAFFDKSSALTKLPGAIVTKTTFKKMPALDVSTVGNGRCGYLRFVQAGADNLVMAAEAAPDACAGLDAQGAIFFKSLVIKK
jgi:hypothetical protein